MEKKNKMQKKEQDQQDQRVNESISTRQWHVLIITLSLRTIRVPHFHTQQSKTGPVKLALSELVRDGDEAPNIHNFPNKNPHASTDSAY